MSFCRWRGRRRLGWIRESETRRAERSSSQPKVRAGPASGGNARAESAATARITRFSTAVHIYRVVLTENGIEGTLSQQRRRHGTWVALSADAAWGHGVRGTPSGGAGCGLVHGDLLR